MKRWIKRTLIGVFGASVLFERRWPPARTRTYHGAGWQAMSEKTRPR